jgi:hypothetical protein
LVFWGKNRRRARYISITQLRAPENIFVLKNFHICTQVIPSLQALSWYCCLFLLMQAYFVIEGVEKSLGLNPSDPLVQFTFLLGGSAVIG